MPFFAVQAVVVMKLFVTRAQLLSEPTGRRDMPHAFDRCETVFDLQHGEFMKIRGGLGRPSSGVIHENC